MDFKKSSPDQLTFWRQHVEQAATHGGSLADYARQHGLNPNALYRWNASLQRQLPMKATAIAKKPVGFSAVQIVAPRTATPTVPAASYAVQVSGQVMLLCATLPDPQWLVALSRQLEVRS